MARAVSRARAAEADAADAGALPLGPPLTKEMRAATRRAHHAANALILAKLAVALHDRRTYARALAAFHPVYSALERLLKLHTSHPLLGPVARAALPLARTAAMEEDLAFLLAGWGGGGGGGGEDVPAGPEAAVGAARAGGGGRKGGGGGQGGEDEDAAPAPARRRPAPVAAGWRWAAAASSSAQAYARHLEELADEDPALLIPYAWSLYVPVTLGFMGRRVAKGLGLPPPGGQAPPPSSSSPSSSPPQLPPLPSAGVRFFDLRATAGLDGAAALAALRAAVDAAGQRLPAAARRRVVDEAREQFRRNNAVVLEFPLGARDVLRVAVARGRVVLALLLVLLLGGLVVAMARRR